VLIPVFEKQINHLKKMGVQCGLPSNYPYPLPLLIVGDRFVDEALYLVNRHTFLGRGLPAGSVALITGKIAMGG